LVRLVVLDERALGLALLIASLISIALRAASTITIASPASAPTSTCWAALVVPALCRIFVPRAAVALTATTAATLIIAAVLPPLLAPAPFAATAAAIVLTRSSIALLQVAWRAFARRPLMARPLRIESGRRIVHFRFR
jgi:hypothetical protein